MIIKKTSSIARTPVSMPGATETDMQMLLGPGDGCPNFAMRKFTVHPGGHTPHHQHDYEHEVLVLAGRGHAVMPDGSRQLLEPGDVAYVPANQMHQFLNAGPTDFEFICLVPAKVHQPVNCS
jgi:quercetin dioxygenase-like cupin family protein